MGSSGLVGGGVGLWKSGLGSVWAIDPVAVSSIANKVPNAQAHPLRVVELIDNKVNSLSFEFDLNMSDSY